MKGTKLFIVFILLFHLLVAVKPPKPLVIGHRGYGALGLEPENTLRAFKRAIDIGLEFVECDIRYTKDKHIVVIHDDSVDRTTNGNIFSKIINIV